MKKIFCISLLLYLVATVSAQTILKGDMNDDEKVTIADVTSLVNVILGKAPQETINISGNPFEPNNSMVVGTWISPEGSRFTLNEDGTADFSASESYVASYYEFFPTQGRLLFLDASKNPVRLLPIVKVTSDYLLAFNYVTGQFTNYVKYDPYQYVDLGLPSGTLWATMNVGANSPEDYGDYFAWGETEGYNSGKTDFSWKTYKWCEGSYTMMTKYCYNSEYGYNGFTDNKTELDLEDDAAYVNWGPRWRMPSLEQMQELINSEYTTTEWTTQNGVNGRRITSKINGNSIFLPAAGYRINSSLSNAGSYGNYWSRSPISDSPSYAKYLFTNSSAVGTNYFIHYRDLGLNVRPVRVQNIPPLQLSTASLSLTTGSQGTVDVTSGSGNYDALSNATNVATVAVEGAKLIISAVGQGSATITVKDNQTLETANIEVTVSATPTPEPGNHEWVDLGLPSGTLWATCNIGASSPEGYGDYFAWGETEGYNSGKTDFSLSTYKWCEGSDNTMTKYCYNSDYGYNGFTDNKTELDLEDDAAYVNWGTAWRMPSTIQFLELVGGDYTTTEWTRQNGVYGRKITSKSNGNSIFLPAAGYRYNNSTNGGGSVGQYWSRTLSSPSPSNATQLHIDSSYNTTEKEGRYIGLCVRPVRTAE